MACLTGGPEAPKNQRELLTEIWLMAGLNARQAMEQIRSLLT